MKTRGFLIISLVSLLLFALHATANLLRPEFKMLDSVIYDFLIDYRAPLWLGFNEFISFFGSAFFLFTFNSILAVRIIMRGYVLAAIWVILVPAMGLLLNASLKVLFDRARPLTYETFTRLANESYPSGHVAGSIVFLGTAYWALTRLTKKRPAPLGTLIGFIAAMCMTRVFLGAHWFNDVIGGIFFGSAWLFATLSIAQKISILPDEKISTYSL